MPANARREVGYWIMVAIMCGVCIAQQITLNERGPRIDRIESILNDRGPRFDKFEKLLKEAIKREGPE